ncbi:MAG: putative ribosome maturation protein SBDS [Streblomastix strix]|uniref:Putative ribosome maturation protein SBDS n=1 Tax=Streblomastix strix TaxID=222440 RepID=A0A5J4VXF7_9EUKA|nr:MAG: putative ribosome maturation protein SBDS [Streblomastix strix]
MLQLYDQRRGGNGLKLPVSRISERDIDEVLQTKEVYQNVSKGIFAKSDLLKACFQSDNREQICLEILETGELQLGEKERDIANTTTFRDIATFIVERCVQSETNAALPVEMIEKELKNIKFPINPRKNAKKQALDAIKQLQMEGRPIKRVQMRLSITVPQELFNDLQLLLRPNVVSIEKEQINEIKQYSNSGLNSDIRIQNLNMQTMIVRIEPQMFRVIQEVVQMTALEQGSIEIIDNFVAAEDEDRSDRSSTRTGTSSNIFGLQQPLNTTSTNYTTIGQRAQKENKECIESDDDQKDNLNSLEQKEIEDENEGQQQDEQSNNEQKQQIDDIDKDESSTNDGDQNSSKQSELSDENNENNKTENKDNNPKQQQFGRKKKIKQFLTEEDRVRDREQRKKQKKEIIEDENDYFTIERRKKKKKKKVGRRKKANDRVDDDTTSQDEPNIKGNDTKEMLSNKEGKIQQDEKDKDNKIQSKDTNPMNDSSNLNNEQNEKKTQEEEDDDDEVYYIGGRERRKKRREELQKYRKQKKEIEKINKEKELKSQPGVQIWDEGEQEEMWKEEESQDENIEDSKDKVEQQDNQCEDNINPQNVKSIEQSSIDNNSQLILLDNNKEQDITNQQKEPQNKKRNKNRRKK